MSFAVIFPGQGTQQAAMGAPWRDDAAFCLIAEAESALGEPLAHLILDATSDELSRTRNAQLAVLLTSLVAWESIKSSLDTPVAFAGHSLGQVTAMIASGALSLHDGVRFAARRAELTQAAADAHPGRMAALIGATPEQAQDACAAAPDACWVANDNAPGQVVIAGTPDGLAAASARAKEIGIKRVLPLDVGGAFHTPLMNPARDGLRARLVETTIVDSSVPVVSNHDGLPYTDAKGWTERLAEHVTVPVRWRYCQETLAKLGATTFIEVGNGTMLASLAKRTVPEVSVIGIANPSDLIQLRELS